MALEMSLPIEEIKSSPDISTQDYNKLWKEAKQRRSALIIEIPQEENVLVYTQQNVRDRNSIEALDFMVKTVYGAGREIAAYFIDRRLMAEEMSMPMDRYQIMMVLKPPKEAMWFLKP